MNPPEAQRLRAGPRRSSQLVPPILGSENVHFELVEDEDIMELEDEDITEELEEVDDELSASAVPARLNASDPATRTLTNFFIKIC